MKASVILCTYNRAMYLIDFLNYMKNQSISTSDYELVIVNDGSTDGSDAVINSYLDVLPIHYVNLETNVGKDKAVFIGANHAVSDYLLFTDDDCLVDPNWIEEMIRELQSYPLIAGRISTPEYPYLTLCRNISEFHEFMGFNPKNKIKFLAGANMGIQKEVLLAIGKIPETSTSFDTNLAFHAVENGYVIHYSPAPMIKHQPEDKPFSSLWNYEVKRAMMTIQLRFKFRATIGTPIILQHSWMVLLLSPLIAAGRSLQIVMKNPVIKWIHTLPVVFALKIAWCWGSYKGLRFIGR